LTLSLPGIHKRTNQVLQATIPTYYSGPAFRAWQHEAFVAWREAGRRGVVEAVTGTGKTTVGIFAAADAASRGLRKVAALEMLSPVLDLAKRALVFTETVNSAKLAAEALRSLKISAFDYTSELDRDTLKERLSGFRSGSIRVLAAPRKLDEGVDVPEADVGIVIAASSSRRQMIQRMGRIISWGRIRSRLVALDM
ncbi:MAG: hypothetical protein M3Q45_01890, partial [Chloroflexota bacterium]|nr:hypothetical protein [Chloroflexota bacterium]